MPNKEKGFSKVAQIYRNRSQRAKELKAAGKKLIGYPCVYVPLEMLTALDLVPYRTCPDIKEPITEVDRALPHSFCPIMRNCLDCALKGKNDFLDGMVAIHSSDPQEKTARIWESYTHHSYFHFIDMPITVRPEAVEYFKGQLDDFKKTLEAFAGKRLSPDNLEAAIKSHNQQRSLVRDLFELTKSPEPLVSGTEIVQVVKALSSLPVIEGNDLIAEAISEARNRPNLRREGMDSFAPHRKSGPSPSPVMPAKAGIAPAPRLLIWSSTLDDTEIMQVLEAKANVVMNESCGGIRAYRGKVKLTADPLEGLADYYLNEITCARTFRQATLGETSKDYARDLQSRFGYLKDSIKDWRVDGVIMLLVRYCDPFAFEMPQLKDYLGSLRVPNTYIEYDYTTGALAPLRTRVEAFLETIEA